MLQGRGTLTDQLMNVIQVIQLGRKSGRLSVERGEGTTLERGEMTFVQGQITQAQAGQLSGQQAVSWLSTWRTCRFTFHAATEPSRTKHITGLLHQQDLQTAKDTPPFLRTPNQSTTQGLPRIDLQHTTGPLMNDVKPQRRMPGEAALQRLEQAGLSRLHRHLLLLIDGQRNLTELARLMGKQQGEIHRLLNDLERLGII